MLMHISMAQALDLWSQLEQAYFQDNCYGTNKAEIYAYTLRPDCPSRYAKGFGMFGKDAISTDIAAAHALREILVYFAEKRDAAIFVNDTPLAGWVPEPEDHRWHVKVMPNSSSRRKS